MLVWPWNPKTIFIIQEFFKILNCFFLVWPFILLKSRSSKSWKFFLVEIVCKGYQKKHTVLRWFQKSAWRPTQRCFPPKTLCCKIFSVHKKSVFQPKIFSFIQNTIVLHLFEMSGNCTSINTLCGKFQRNFFQTLIRAVLIFLSDKRLNNN